MQIQPTLNVKKSLNTNCSCQQNQEWRPVQHYRYFERILRKGNGFCLNSLKIKK